MTIKHHLYILSDGSEDDSYPMLLRTRDSKINEAKKIASTLNWTKKLSNEDFIDVYQNNKDVIHYRQLLREIWDFKVEKYIVKKIDVCWSCKERNNLYQIDFISSGGFEHSYLLCSNCIDVYLDLYEVKPGQYTKIPAIQ